jgi:hypothetical protein
MQQRLDVAQQWLGGLAGECATASSAQDQRPCSRHHRTHQEVVVSAAAASGCTTAPDCRRDVDGPEKTPRCSMYGDFGVMIAAAAGAEGARPGSADRSERFQ